MSKLMHNVRAYTFWYLQFYISAYTTLNELLAVFLYIIFAVLLKFERSLDSYFVHNNYYYYYYATPSILNFVVRLIEWQACRAYVGPQI